MSTSSNSLVEAADRAANTKLVSLLALASGAVALPQSGLADIIYTDLSSAPVHVGFAADAEYRFALPGAAQFGFQRIHSSTYTQPASVLTINYRLVLAGDLGGNQSGLHGAGNLAAHLPSGATWDAGGGGLFYNIPVGIVNDFGQSNPAAGYDHQYLAWIFFDDTAGGAARYGWAEVSLSMSGYNAGGPLVTIWGYGYDNTGAKPTMGQLPVPEPASGALLALGAMAMGARGLRKWRQDRRPANPA